MLDLEHTGALALSGDPDRCLDLGRFIAAELAVNAWSDQVSVTVVGFGAELVDLNPDRLRHATNLGSTAEALTAELATAIAAGDTVGLDVLSGRMRAVAGDSWLPHVLLVGPHRAQDTADTGRLDALLAALSERSDRSTVAVVLAGEQGATSSANLQASISADGRLTIPSLGVQMRAQQMPAEQGAALARLLEQAARLDDASVPASTGTKPYDRYIDAAGALLPAVTMPRVTVNPSATVPGPTSLLIPSARAEMVCETGEDDDATSVLPNDDEDYLRDGAASPEELQTLAPRVTAHQRVEIIAADPTLDDDLADWHNPASPTPKVTLLGPAAVRAAGVRPPKRISYYTEMAAFVATRDHGATAEQVAAAFDMATTSAYSRLNTVRNWFGTNPTTGAKYLPESTQSAAGKARGVGVYEFVDVLVDADLFKRLRARGLALGGTDGLACLQAALDLVSGQPFAHLRPDGYGWLAESPMDHHLVVAIVDAAHTAHLHYLIAGDLGRARAAAETALRAAPYEEIPRLDLVAVMKAEGLDEEADRYLREGVCNRSEDGQAPDDPPERTQEILRRQEWLSPRSHLQLT